MQMEKFSDKVIRSHHNAMVRKGFWEVQTSKETRILLVCGELGEALEALRTNKMDGVSGFETRLGELNDSINLSLPDDERENLATKHFIQCYKSYIKGTVAEEIADVYLRIADILGGIKTGKLEAEEFEIGTLPQYEPTFEGLSIAIHRLLLTFIDHPYVVFLEKSLELVEEMATVFNINLRKHINLKMFFNQYRPKLHGKSF